MVAAHNDGVARPSICLLWMIARRWARPSAPFTGSVEFPAGRIVSGILHRADSRPADRLDQAAAAGGKCRRKSRRAGGGSSRRSAWSFVTCPVHGGFSDGDVLFSGATITAVTNWQNMQVNDPARDLAWIFGKLDEDHRNAVLAAIWPHDGFSSGRSDHAAREPVAANGAGRRVHRCVEPGR